MVEKMPWSQKFIQISVLFFWGGGGWREWGVSFGYRVSAWENEKVLEVDGQQGELT